MTSSQHGAYAQGHTHPTMAKNSGLRSRKAELIPEISPQFRLPAETRPHEVGLGSNRGSAGRGEYVLGSCTVRTKQEAICLITDTEYVGPRWKRKEIITT
jgi:hypothetical protein